MNILDKTTSPVEIASVEYKHTWRFLSCLYPKNGKQLKYKYELDFAVDEELKRIQNGTSKIPGFPKIKREFHEYSLDIRLTLLLCTRISNIAKIIYILNKYKSNDRYSSSDTDAVCIMLDHIETTLQEEFHDLYGEYYNSALKSSSFYRSVHGRGVCFTEYIIYLDMFSYFMADIMGSRDLYAYNQKAVMQYMAVVYLQTELELLAIDFSDTADAIKSEKSFKEYHLYIKNAKEKMSYMNSFLNSYKAKVNISSIRSYIAKHQLILLEDEDLNG